MKRHETSIHHMICTSRGGSDRDINRKKLDHHHHQFYHHCFGNCLPHEAIAQIIMEHREVLKEEFLQMMAYILSASPEEMYQKEAFVDDDAVREVMEKQKNALRLLLCEYA